MQQVNLKWNGRMRIKKGIPLLILGITKSSKNLLNSIAGNLLNNPELYKIKFFIFVDSEVDITDYHSIVWYVTANIDPIRDCRIIEPSREREQPHLIVDGTRKSFVNDGFIRDWPNPVVSSADTIDCIDNMWPKLGLGEFIPSPSLKYLPLQKGQGAISEDIK